MRKERGGEGTRENVEREWREKRREKKKMEGGGTEEDPISPERSHDESYEEGRDGPK